MTTNEPTHPPATSAPKRFCVPAAEGQMAEDAWQAVRATAPFPTTDRRVQRLRYNNWRGVFTTEVGYIENDDERDWLTFAIFEPANAGHPWMIAIMILTSEGPQFRNPPILVSQSDVLEVMDFLDES